VFVVSQVSFDQFAFSPNQTISDDQGTWIKESNEKVFRILRETPPDGEKFAEAIEVRSALHLTPSILHFESTAFNIVCTVFNNFLSFQSQPS